MSQTQHITWEMIRLNAISMGWGFIIRNEQMQHLLSIGAENDPSNYQTLHMFYRKIATPIERRHMLKAGYQPVC